MAVINGTSNDDTLTGTPDADVIDGKQGSDQIFGLAGNDDLFGGIDGHVDVIDAGADDDLIRGIRRGEDEVDGGDGFDVFRLFGDQNTVIFRDLSTDSYVEDTLDIGPGGVVSVLHVTFVDNFGAPNQVVTRRSADLDNVESIEFVFTDDDPNPIFAIPGGTVIQSNTNDRVTIPNLDATDLTGRIYFEGGSGNDVLIATEVSNVVEAHGERDDDTLSSGNGNDHLWGDEGNDQLDGGAGLDTLEGGVGDDGYVLSDADIIIENVDEGTDEVRTDMASATLGANLEHLTFIGVGNFTGTGNALANLLTGGAGNDTLNGAGGDDTLVGLQGNNILNGGADIDTAQYITAPAAVTVRLNAGTATNGYGGTDTLISVENAIGSAHNDTLIGSSGANRLEGLQGSDYLIGLDGDDLLIGGTGATNALQGGLGNDTYVVALEGDSLIEFAGEGTDTVQTILTTYRLRANLENLVYTGFGDFTGIGNDSGNAISGDNGNDRLIGLGGNNVLAGGLGTDTIDYSGATGGVTANLNSGVISANGYGGSDTASGIEQLIGSAQNDTLIGNGANNRLEGGAGGDYLIGLAGDDLLIGGAGTPNALQGGIGNDVYIVAVANDTLTEFASEGTDRIETALSSYRLPANVENLVYTGTGNFVGIGNGLGNAITAGGGNDVLNGGEGSDVLTGGAGADILMFNTVLGINNIDALPGFQPGVDEIRLDDFIFTALTPGALPAGAFATGLSAGEADDRIIYNPSTGSLFYDPDGVGGQVATKFAELSPGLTDLSANDFFVI